MRPLITLLFVLSLLFGMLTYTRFANSVTRPAQNYSIDFAEGKFEVQIERSFECIPFEIAEIDALQVSLKGETVYRSAEKLPVDRQVRFSIEDGIEIGENELLIVANRDFLAEGLAAMRATVFWNDIPIANKLISGEPDMETISGTVLFQVKRTEKVDEHSH